MNIMLITSIYLASTILAKCSNPVKMSMILVFQSTILFLYLYLKTGNSWFPLMFVLLFMGGILMMFMILSSILPNEKNKEKNMALNMLNFMVPIFLISTFKESSTFSSFLQIKTMITSSVTLKFSILLILLYFFIMIFIIKMEELPMRSTTCQMKKIL